MHEQRPVSPAVQVADRRWQRMLHEGTVWAAAGAELDRIIQDWAINSTQSYDAPERFRLAASIWWHVTRPGTLERLTRPTIAFISRHSELVELIRVAVSHDAVAELVDGVWAMLRPTAAVRACGLSPDAITRFPGHHRLMPPPVKQEWSGPYASFAGYSDPMTTSLAGQWADAHRRLICDRSTGGIRWGVTKGQTKPLLLICANGHSFENVPNARRKSHKTDTGGCPYCSGLTPLPGFRSMYDDNGPALPFWHPKRNLPLTPRDVASGSAHSMWWRCQIGHDFRSPLVSMNRRPRCPICLGRRVLVGFNDLATRNPALAAQWHPTKNAPLTPQQVVLHSTKNVWWRCIRGHEIQSTVTARSGHSNCPVCTNRRIVADANSLQLLCPEVAAEWHPTRNGNQTPSTVGAGSSKHAWWMCPLGHEYDAAIVRRVNNGAGCAYCRMKRALPGFNDVATKHPTLVKEWAYDLNPDFDPHRKMPTHRKFWWRCSHGHVAAAILHNRMKSGGCAVCPKEQRILRR